MVAFTPNRGYPYSQPTDPADVPFAIQSLAEAIDVDMQNLDDIVVGRPFASVSWVAPVGTRQTFPPNTTTVCEFNFVDADNAGISNLSDAPTKLTPTSPGLWMAWGMLALPNAQGTLGTALFDAFIRVNDADITRYGDLANDPGGTVFGKTLGTMHYMDGVDDYFTLTFNPLAMLEDMKLSFLRLACMRITDT